MERLYKGTKFVIYIYICETHIKYKTARSKMINERNSKSSEAGVRSYLS